MSNTDIIKDSIAPFVQRILSDPLQFKPAKHPDVITNKPSSYIKIGKATKDDSKAPSTKSTVFDKKEDKPMDRARKSVTSLAQALAGYTGKRAIDDEPDKKSKKPKRAKLQSVQEPQTYTSENDDDIGEALESNEDSDDSPEQESSSDEDDDANYTDAKSPDFVSETPHNIISKKVFQQFQSEKSSSDDNDNDNNDDASDENDDEEKVTSVSSDEESEDDDYVESKSNEDSENDVGSGSESGDEKSSTASDRDDSGDESDEIELLKKELRTDKAKTESSPATPPTSPESDNDKLIKPSQQEPTNKIDNYYQFDEAPSDRGSNESSRILKNWGSLLSKSKPLGLLNHGVTCYTNAAVQAMVHIPAVQHYLMDVLDGKHKEINPRSVTHVLAETASRMWNLEKTKKHSSKYINPKKLISRLDDINCMMSEWQQEDSHEYFMSLLSRLQEDSTPKGHKLNESIIYDIFGGLLNQSVTCKSCGHISKTNQEFYDLSLHLGASRKNSETATTEESNTPSQRYSIQKSIRDFFSPELIKTDKSDKSGYVCESCKKRTNAMKISSIARAPETLAVHLKRFRFNGSSSSKVKQGVSYPSLLDLSQYTTNNENALYQLISVVVHEGRSVSSGHYVAHCRQPDGTWATYDDEYINAITEKQALRDPSAYYLIYTRLTHKDTKLAPTPSKSVKSTPSKKSTQSPSINRHSLSSPALSSPSQASKLSSKVMIPKTRQDLRKKKLSGLHPTNNLGNIKKSQKKYDKNPKNQVKSKRFNKY